MNYLHTVRFVPTGETPRSASETKTVTVETPQRCPDDTTSNKAIGSLCQQINPYAARNHWEVHDFLTTPSDPPWTTAISVQRVLKSDDEVVDTVQTVSKGRERYALVHTTDGMMVRDFQDYVRSLYDSQPLGVLIEPQSPTKKCVYFKWETTR